MANLVPQIPFHFPRVRPNGGGGICAVQRRSHQGAGLQIPRARQSPGFAGMGVSYRYSLTLGIGALNVFNIVNLGTPVGQLSSPLFGKSKSLAGRFGPPGGGNRNIDFQVAFSF